MMSAYPKLQLLIGNEWRQPDGEPVINPADESVLGTMPHATAADVSDAIQAAAAGFKQWRSMATTERTSIILKAVQLMRERIDEFAIAMTLEEGKPLAEARAEVLRGCEFIEWDAQEGRRLYGRTLQSAPGLIHTTIRQPVGPVAAITAWNFPMSTPARKVGAALSAGCSVILKPSEEVPAGGYLLTRAFHDAGLPDGVLNLLMGDAAAITDQIIADRAIRLISFTGSVPIGKRIASGMAAQMKPVVMELGGHAPVIICSDADPEQAAALSVAAKARNAGQVCTAPTRFFVEDAVYERFTQAFVEHARALKVGDGRDSTTQIGPLANGRRLSAMADLVEDAVGHGARLLCGGQRIGQKGYYFPLTVLADVPDQARTMYQEPFGPIALINRVGSVDEALSKANALPYGLAAYAFTQSARNVEQISREIEAGNLAINQFKASVAETPFGGVKDSGYGREGGQEGVSSYTVTKNISHRIL